MNYHPDVLAAHAEFGGDLQAMQALYDRPDHIARIAALEERLAARTGAVKVKPLEWTELSTGWIAHTTFHAYEVVKTDQGFMATYANMDFAWGAEDAMKVAAQADYERRILSALEPHPRSTNTVEPHETANVSDKPKGQQQCATEGCDNPATNEFIRGDTGSYYCGDCFVKVIEVCEPEGQQEPVAWEDREDDMSAAILNSHPTRSKSYSTYERAMELVSNRHSKGALVMMVNHLLIQAETRPTEQAVTEAMLRSAIIAYRDTPEYDHHIALRNALKAAMEAGG